MDNVLEDYSKKISEIRSLMHYYRGDKSNRLHQAKAKILKNVLEELKEEKKKLKYEYDVAKFLEEHPEMSYMFEEDYIDDIK